MIQDDRWLAKYNEVLDFIKTNHRNPSRHELEERYKYLNWMKHNRKFYAAGLLKKDMAEKFKALLGLSEAFERKNQ